MNKLCFIFIIGASFLCQISLAQQTTRTIFLVRHAEKQSAAPTASLSPAGQKRAECLAQTFKDSGIKQIFVTESKASQETAEPLAKALNLKPSTIPARDVANLMRNLVYGASGNALVISQSDTLPVIVGRLQGSAAKPVAENDYDRLFVSMVVEGAGTPAATLHYCSAPGSTVAQPAAAKHPAAKAPAKKP